MRLKAGNVSACHLCCLVAGSESNEVNLEDNICFNKCLSLENQTAQAHSPIGIGLHKALLTLTKR